MLYDVSGASFNQAKKRCIVPHAVEAGEILHSVTVKTYQSVDQTLEIQIWEQDGVVLKLVDQKSVVVGYADINKRVEVFIGRYCTKPTYVSFYGSVDGYAGTFYSSKTGEKFWTVIDDGATAVNMTTGLETYANLALDAKIVKRKITGSVDLNVWPSFSGWMDGNIVAFGDSTVDGVSTTGHNGNMIGTDRTAAQEPNCWTSVLERMIKAYTGRNLRVYNSGFGGKTLNYIADNYDAIMAAFSNVKSAIVVLDVNSAAVDYVDGIRNGLTRLIDLLKADGIACVVSTPQPMAYYPAAEGVGINSAAEFAYAVSIAKDICRAKNVPMIDTGGKVSEFMDSAKLPSNWYYGDRIHFGDNGHKLEAYAIYSQLFHPIAEIDSGAMELTFNSNVVESPASVISKLFNSMQYGYTFLNDTVTSDLLQRVYVANTTQIHIKPIKSRWERGFTIYVDGVAYPVVDKGEQFAFGSVIDSGVHLVEVYGVGGETKTNYTGLVLESTKEEQMNSNINKIKSDISNLAGSISAETERAKAEEERIESLFDLSTQEAIGDWLDAHPEATTTVMDGAITEPKINSLLRPKVMNQFVTPQMFGAVGDGVADDTEAFEAATAYLRAKLVSSGSNAATSNDYTPSRIIAGAVMKIPAGIYRVSRPIVIPTCCAIIGDGSECTTIRSTAAYGISLDGDSYNNEKTFCNGRVEGLAVIMNGQGIGLSNTQLSGQGEPNCVQNSVFMDVMVHNATVGVLLQGVWNSRLERCETKSTEFGYIIDLNHFSGGSNNNTMVNCRSVSTVQCGLWCNSKGLLADQFDCELVWNTWKPHAPVMPTFTENGVTYSTEKPCGIYVTGRPFVTIRGPWFERYQDATIEDATLSIPCIMISGVEVPSGDIHPWGSVVVERPFFNGDCKLPVYINGPVHFTLVKPHYPATYPMVVLDGYVETGTYELIGLRGWHIRNLKAANQSTYGQFILKDIRDGGSQGYFDKFWCSNTSGVILEAERYDYLGADGNANPTYSFARRKYLNTSNTTLYDRFDDKSLVAYHYGYGSVGLPQQAGTVTVAASAKTVDIPTTAAGQEGMTVALTAKNASGAALVTGGYFIKSFAWGQKITIEFVGTVQDECELNYTVLTA